jgi:hypothetical protein
MNQLTKKFSATAVVLISSLLITSCGSGGASASFDLDTTQTAISTVFPKCKLEKVEIAQEGKTQGLSKEIRIVGDYIDYFTDFSGVLANTEEILATYKNSGWNTSQDEIVFTWKLNSVKDIYVCNTNGISLAEYDNIRDSENTDYIRYRGEDYNNCQFYQPFSAEESKEAQKCLETLNSLQNNGEWIVITTMNDKSPTEVLKTFMTGLVDVYDSEANRQPVAVTESFAVNLAADLRAVSDARIELRNTLWKSVVKALGATTWEKLDESGSNFLGDFSGSYLPEGFLKTVIAREPEVPEVVECNTALRINENSASSGDCGKIKIEVFQSDLNTGECTFLGYWNDANGSSRIGIFRYCDVYTAGSIQEDSFYTLRVQVSGPESYTTKGGTTSRVLAFTVLGN